MLTKCNLQNRSQITGHLVIDNDTDGELVELTPTASHELALARKKAAAYLATGYTNLTDEGPHPLVFGRWNARAPNEAEVKTIEDDIVTSGALWYTNRIPLVVSKEAVANLQLLQMDNGRRLPEIPSSFKKIEWCMDMIETHPRYSCGGNHRRLAYIGRDARLSESLAEAEMEIKKLEGIQDKSSGEIWEIQHWYTKRTRIESAIRVGNTWLFDLYDTGGPEPTYIS